MNASTSPIREELLEDVAKRILALETRACLRIGVDGVDGAGKTHFADELAPFLGKSGRAVIRSSVDGFHNPRDVRYRNGKTAESFFRDSFDYKKMYEMLLAPLGPDGNGRYRTSVFDHRTDSAVDCQATQASPGSILMVDGIFLHRPELADQWDFSIFLDVDFQISVPRGAQRGEGFGSLDPLAASNQRYVGGQQLYFRECQPWRAATLVIDNNDLNHPKVRSFSN